MGVSRRLPPAVGARIAINPQLDPANLSEKIVNARLAAFKCASNPRAPPQTWTSAHATPATGRALS